MPRKDAVRLIVGGSSYSGWLSVDLDSDIFTPADGWVVSARSPGQNLLSVFREGTRVEIYVGDDRQMAGVIDDVAMQGDRKGERLTLTGRDLAAYLQDSEAPSAPAKNLTLVDLVKKLLLPSWGIRNVLTSNEANRKLVLGKKDRRSTKGTSARGGSVWGNLPRALQAIDPGQRVAAILDHRTRQLGIAWWMTAKGDLFLGRPNYTQEPSFHFRVVAPRGSQRSNVESWEVERAMGDRYSEITVLGQGMAASGHLNKASSHKRAKFKATAKDPDLVDRGIDRKLIIVDNDVISQEQAQRRADFEMGMRRLRGLTVRLTVPGFAQDDRLFAVDTLAQVDIEPAAISGVFYVTQRRFIESRQRRRTSLTLFQPKVWLA